MLEPGAVYQWHIPGVWKLTGTVTIRDNDAEAVYGDGEREIYPHRTIEEWLAFHAAERLTGRDDVVIERIK